ncbi:UbiH/UbiF/VisC/COQ6 family ubiquinone biosynthesis hydroxylase [Coxiella endosymbiont of Amblyomma nuttalli]|uniref:UbiH/UbiF/VisC/COQ6 family ubiquinone biosynthesis hydroxylase n=1 Tax=Coxiella endosymbiont of Amblyomma nuttalli TaxID=2749996 RepID=UPI001BADBC4F|nr:UbiH/UbiF/VisC/COQ6 family ubiquinone biosynthesis hydroxylase [Coxiella endosymbiont of Amblyomma nuttalli]
MMKKPSELKPLTIIGGGMVGLLLAALLADGKINVVVVEAEKPLLRWDKDNLDSRVSAINVASQCLLKTIDIWKEISSRAYSPLIKLKVWDGLGGAEVMFDSADVGTPSLGAIVENREIIRVLWRRLQNDPYVTLICPAKPLNLLLSKDFIELELNNKQKIQTFCLVGADGSDSWLREKMRIELSEHAYKQSAVVTVVKTVNDHQQTGWQVFLPEAVLALLPLNDPHHCAMVWSLSTEEVDKLMMMKERTFNVALNNAFGSRLGGIFCLNSPRSFPLIMRHAKKYVRPRMVLMGDAAHTIHPLAGQGVNLGFMDAACLAQCIIDAQQEQRDVGSLRVLRRYERWRKSDNVMMLVAIALLKECFCTQFPFIVQARNVGLTIVDRLNFFKNCCMKIAMGKIGNLPKLMKR